MYTEYNDVMNEDNAWKGIIAEWDYLLPQDSGKDITLPKEGGNTSGKEGI